MKIRRNNNTQTTVFMVSSQREKRTAIDVIKYDMGISSYLIRETRDGNIVVRAALSNEEIKAYKSYMSLLIDNNDSELYSCDYEYLSGREDFIPDKASYCGTRLAQFSY